MQSSSASNQTLTSPTEVSLREIAALRAADIEQLQQQGITSNLDLLRVAGRKSQRAAFAEKLDATVQQVNRWVVLADLSRVPAVGQLYCDFLLQIGICSTVQLARTPLEDLQRQVTRFQMPVLQQGALCPDMSLIATWKHQAEQLTAQPRQPQR